VTRRIRATVTQGGASAGWRQRRRRGGPADRTGEGHWSTYKRCSVHDLVVAWGRAIDHELVTLLRLLLGSTDPTRRTSDNRGSKSVHEAAHSGDETRQRRQVSGIDDAQMPSSSSGRCEQASWRKCARATPTVVDGEGAVRGTLHAAAADVGAHTVGSPYCILDFGFVIQLRIKAPFTDDILSQACRCRGCSPSGNLRGCAPVRAPAVASGSAPA
jgi:hypothetical protein